MLELDDVRPTRPPPRSMIGRDLSVGAALGKVVDPVVKSGQWGGGVPNGRVGAIRPPHRMVEVVAHGDSGRLAPPGPQRACVGAKRCAEDRPPPATAVRVSQHTEVALERNQVAPSELPAQNTVGPSEPPPKAMADLAHPP